MSKSVPFQRMPWYPRDFASATRTWPLVARAVYRELLDAQWDIGGMQPGVLPDDPRELRELARASDTEWKVAWRFLARKFPRVRGGRQNRRLEEHRQSAVAEYRKRQKGAQLTNAKRWGDSSLSESPSESLSDHGPNGSCVAERSV